MEEALNKEGFADNEGLALSIARRAEVLFPGSPQCHSPPHGPPVRVADALPVAGGDPPHPGGLRREPGLDNTARFISTCWAAIFLGGAITLFPVSLALLQPGKKLTRYVIAVSQMLMSALLIHMTGGRIETHFHVFGSLAILAIYRDWRVFIPATLIVAVDHFVRGVYFPQSVFGVLVTSPWRWVEHAGWVIFEDIFLIRSCFQSMQEMRNIAHQTAELEAAHAMVEAQGAGADGRITRQPEGPARGQGNRRRPQASQEHVPGEHEPRDPHADERHPRHDRARARYRSYCRAARIPRTWSGSRPSRCWRSSTTSSISPRSRPASSISNPSLSVCAQIWRRP